MMPPKLGIIAGGGNMPRELADACKAQGRECFVLGIEGACDGPADAAVPLGAVGDALAHLKAAKAEELVLAGSIKRPSMGKLKLDATGAKLMAKLGLRLFGGDDALLREIVRFLESEGFTVISADSITGALLAEEGIYTVKKPDAEADADIALGLKAAHALGALDIGQAVVVEAGAVLAVEAAEGTDALIARSASLLREEKRAVLVKAKKPGQDGRADLPTIGKDTVRHAAEAGFLGIAVEAGAAQLLNKDAMVKRADALGIFVTGVKP